MAEAANQEVAGGGASEANSLVLTATSSFSSTLSSSDADTESISSFFPERGISLASLIGIAGGGTAIADDNLPSAPRSCGINHVNGHAVRRASRSSQDISCSHVNRIRDNAKLWSMLPCGTCLYAHCRSICKLGFCCANKGNKCVVSSPTRPLTSSLGHFLIAERVADRDAERLHNAKVYINIMYEESHIAEEVAVNPLYNLELTPANVSTSCSLHATHRPSRSRIQSQGISGEAGTMLSLHADDKTFMIQGTGMGRKTSMPPTVEAVPGHISVLPTKDQKALSNKACELGCVSYMWTRCRF